MKRQIENGRLAFAVNENEITFTAGELSFKISKDDFLALIDGPGMAERFRLSTPANAAFAELDDVEHCARVWRYLRKGLTLEEMAPLLGVNGEALRLFWSHALSTYPGRQDAKTEIERQGKEERDYCQATGIINQGPNAGQPEEAVFVDVHLAKQRLVGYGNKSRAATTMKLDPKDFELWVEKNQRILDIIK